MGRSFHVQVGKAGGDEQLSDFYTHHNYMRELLSTRENIRGLVFEVSDAYKFRLCFDASTVICIIFVCESDSMSTEYNLYYTILIG